MHATESKLSYFYYHLVYNQTIHVTISCFNVFTYTVRACFHLGLCVLLHFSVLFDWPSTATSTYGLGPNQFFLFSFSFAEITSQLQKEKHHSDITEPVAFQSITNHTNH